jgi:hypothetical protein
MNINRVLLIINTNGALTVSTNTDVELGMNTSSINIFYRHFRGINIYYKKLMGH